MAGPLPVPVTGLRGVLNEVVRTKTGMVGFSMLAVLLSLVLFVPFIAPFDLVREWGNRQAWLDNPRNAAPEWTEWFSGKQLSRTIVMAPCDVPDPVPISNATKRELCP